MNMPTSIRKSLYVKKEILLLKRDFFKHLHVTKNIPFESNKVAKAMISKEIQKFFVVMKNT